jgi:hypothetical protein
MASPNPAIGIDLLLDCICAAQRYSPTIRSLCFGLSTCGTNLLPFDASWRRRRPRCGRRCETDSLPLDAWLPSSGSPAGGSAVDVLGQPDAALGEFGYRLKNLCGG